ncbi:putative RNA-binding protein 15B [Xyrauchen texanus]|uniref:putative RNA-binding protein 15B n=1 Tax=Xyrauchen texanus TaxID=154827 RepID=UPI00224228F7|nr:putative RNA-binding protein 15B [Xyrauchen texanus]
MKRQAERDASPSRTLTKRVRERDRERELNPPLALLLAESRTYHKRSRSREREKPRVREERESLHRPYQELGLLGRAPLRTTTVLPKGKTPSADKVGTRLEYKTLLISNLGSTISDEHIEDGLFHEFKKFGDVSIKLSHTPELGRIAYVNFRHTEKAREARHAKTRLVLYDRPLKVEPMYMRRRSCTPPDVSYVSMHVSAYTYRQRSLSPGAGGSALRDLRPRHYVDGVGLNRDRVLDYYSALEESRCAYAYQLPEDDLKPEDDQRATRNLFIGNLDHNISEVELRQGFEKYGIIEEVVIKRPARGQGSAYAFLKFQNLDMAHRAKVAMQGRMINGNPIKIGYGKANPTTRLWVGGLGPNVSLAALAREFDRFGSIRTIDYVKGDNFAYIHYESLDAAQAACAQMRGFPLGGPNCRLRVDFAKDEETRPYPQQYQPPLLPPPHFDVLPDGYARHRSLERELRARTRSPSHPLFMERERLSDRDLSPLKGLERRANPEVFGRIRQHSRSSSREHWLKERDLEHGVGKNCEERRKRRSLSPIERPIEERRKSKLRGGAPSTPEDSPDRGCGRLPDSTSEPLNHTPDISRHSSDGCPLQDESLHQRRNSERDRNHRKNESDPDSQTDKSKTDSKKPSTLSEYAQMLSCVWHGSLVLKNSCFPTNMHMLEGGASFLHSLMRDNQAGGSKITQLKIAQRLRLDQPKLDEVTRRIKLGSPDGYAVLLAVQGPMDRDAPPPEPGLQHRLLRNLVTYLRNKQAAGVISLPLGGPKEREMGGMLYAFPPCDFSQQYLQTALKTIGKLEEEHMVIVVVKDSS